MKSYLIAFAAAALIFLCALSVFPQKTDVIVMKNGDRMTCEIKSLNGGVLYVSLDYVDGSIALQWSKIAELESDRLFIVKTTGGLVYQGKLRISESTPDQPLTIEVVQAPDKKVEIETQKVVTIGTTSDKFWKRFNGDINLGMSYSKGNASTQYSLNSSVEYPRDRWSAEARFSSNLSSTSGTETSTRNQLTFSARRLLRWNNVFYAGGLSLLESSSQGIAMQINASGGLGYYLKNTNHSRIAIVGGLGWQRTNYKGTGNARRTQNMAAGLVSMEMKLFKFKKSRFDLTATVLPSFSEPGRVYFKANQSYYVKLFSNLSWNISLYGNWDTRPPAGLSGSDYGTSTGLGWTFGNK